MQLRPLVDAVEREARHIHVLPNFWSRQHAGSWVLLGVGVGPEPFWKSRLHHLPDCDGHRAASHRRHHKETQHDVLWHELHVHHTGHGPQLVGDDSHEQQHAVEPRLHTRR